VPEYHDLIGPDFVHTVSRAPSTTSEQLALVAHYQYLDEIRWRQVNGAPNRSLVLMDRCHLSVMAFSRAMESQYGFGAYLQVATEYSERLESTQYALALPDRIVYLEMSQEVAEERIPRLATSMTEDLTNPSFIRSLISSYRDLLEHLDRDVYLISSNGSLGDTIEAVYDVVYES